MWLIDLDELKKFPIRVDTYDKEHGNENFVMGIEAVLEYAENLPTIDAESNSEKMIGVKRMGNVKIMGNNEIAFMRDLHMLFKKYSIDKCAVKENKIIFISNDNTFSFFGYSFGSFYEIGSNASKFTPVYKDGEGEDSETD